MRIGWRYVYQLKTKGPWNMKHLLASLLLLVPGMSADAQPRVELVHHSEAQRIDVTVDGAPFTSYLYTDTIAVLKKPVLYPVHSAGGAQVTRYYPLQPRPNERTDHPHQVGLWFTYGNVNGLDFWNNSDAIPLERAYLMGTIRHRAVESIESGDGQGRLVVRTDWVDHEGNVHLEESTQFVFHGGDGYRAIDRSTTLTADDAPVDLSDNKEGVLGMRVRRELEMPVTEPVELTDASGQVQEVAVLDNEGVSGHYRNSEGVTGYPDVWGKRARWTALSGAVDGEPLTLVLFDHPENVGYPTYWHARDYGLFAANPLGQKDLSEGAESLNYRLGAGESTTFRHRLVIFSGQPTDEEIEAEWAAFVE